MKNKILSIFIIMALAFSCLISLTACNGDTGLEFTKRYDNTYTVSGIGSYKGSDLVIPSTYKGHPVVGIDDNAFNETDSISSVTVANTIEFIGQYAFANCSNLTSITIPTSVTKISNGAFYNCGNLSSITIPTGVTKISDETFSDCYSLQTVLIPNTVKTIGKRAFYMCDSLKSINISKTVKSIDDEAFSYCEKLSSFKYNATINDWLNIEKGKNWSFKVLTNQVECVDGKYSIYK